MASVSFGCAVDDAALGERIFQDGLGSDGRVAYEQGPSWLRHSASGCAACHGRDGEGRTVRAGAVVGSAPPLTAAALAARGYDEASLLAAITMGVDPLGRPLNTYMPRWHFTQREARALLHYLEHL